MSSHQESECNTLSKKVLKQILRAVAVSGLPPIGCVSESTVVMLTLKLSCLTSVLAIFQWRHYLPTVEDASIEASVPWTS